MLFWRYGELWERGYHKFSFCITSFNDEIGLRESMPQLIYGALR